MVGSVFVCWTSWMCTADAVAIAVAIVFAAVAPVVAPLFLYADGCMHKSKPCSPAHAN